MAMHNYTTNNNTGSPNNPGQSQGGGYTPPIPNINNAGQFDINEFCINYNKKFATAGKAPFRETVVEQTLSIMIAKNKPNALLVGPAGTGKTKIVEDIAFRLAANDPVLPDALRGATIWELPLSNIVSGSMFVGQLEEKVNDIIAYFADKSNNAILFIDEIHMLAGDSQTYAKIAQILKPALARGDIRCIGATTTQEVGDIESDPAFNRRFTRLIVDELTPEQTLEILKSIRGQLFIHYNVTPAFQITITDAALEQVVYIADQYKTAGSHRPDNAITLLDRTCGDAIVQRKVMEEQAKNDPVLLNAIKANSTIPITDKMVKKVAMKLATGNSKKAPVDENALRNALSRIKGQDEHIDRIIKNVKKYDSDLYPKKKPTTLLFAGPSGVGKTEVAKIISDYLTGLKPIILNMTEYSDPSTVNRIIGAPPGYVGSDSKRELPFDALESNPYQIIVLDEFEKCCDTVRGLFMSAFEEGSIKTNNGKEIDFSKSLIIATTNAGHTDKAKSISFASSVKSVAGEVNELSKTIKVELLNRFTDRITFNTLNKDIYREIIVNCYHRDLARLQTEQPYMAAKLPADIPDADLDKIVKDTYIEDFGARPANTAVQNYIEDTLL